MGAADQPAEAKPLQLPPNRAADQPAVAGHIDPSISGNVHALSNKPVRKPKQAGMSRLADVRGFSGLGNLFWEPEVRTQNAGSFCRAKQPFLNLRLPHRALSLLGSDSDGFGGAMR